MSVFGAIRRIFAGPRKSATDETGAPIRASYDAARTDGYHTQHWTGADALDANGTNSLAVRRRLTQRSRYETENNGFGKGVTLTQANYVIGRGPKLRMQTGSPGFNAMVEAAWLRWSSRVHMARKFRTAEKAKVRDGETFIIAKQNPSLRDVVKLDLAGIECEQCTSLNLRTGEPYRVDGIKFDEFGNPEYYEVLKYHPGSSWYTATNTTEKIPAKFVFHLYREDRFGQQRAVPEVTSTLNLFAQGRRYREATIAAAENIANFSILTKTQAAPYDGADAVRPYSTLPIEKGMMVHLPMGWDAYQPKAEQPTASYDQFVRSQVSEETRPLSMSYSIAAADSSGNSFSGTKNDHLIYYAAVDVDQADFEDMVLEPLFELWFEEAVKAYGWAVDAEPVPSHAWAWPAKPKIDDQKTATARQIDLDTGVVTLEDLWIEDGYDPDEQWDKLARQNGMTVDEVKKRMAEKRLGPKQQASNPVEPDQDDDEPPARANGVNRIAAMNGNGRH